VPLQDQPFKVLALLLQHAGDLVTREELQHVLWPSDTFVEFDDGLNKAVQKLRQALDDSSDNPRFIETLPRKGYRFIAMVESSIEAVTTAPDRALPHDSAASTLASGAAKRPTREIAAWLLFGIVSLALLVLAGVYFWHLHSASRLISTAVPLTSYPGVQLQPALSPDGKQVAFAWDGEKGDNFDIYVKLINAGEPIRLTTDPAAESHPVWSPDGRYIAFCRELLGHVEIWMIPALGGAARRLAEAARCGLSWSPDGKFLALVNQSTPQAPWSIFLLSIETGETRKVTSPPGDNVGDYSPDFSPDGKNLAFQRNDNDNLYILQLTHGATPSREPRRLILTDPLIRGFDWKDRDTIIYTSARRNGSLWAVRISDGSVEQLPIGVENIREVSIARNGDRLVYVRDVLDDNIWRIPGPNSAERNGAPTRIIASTRTDDEPQFSRNGEKIAFCSARSGNTEVWICDREGHNLLQLTSFGGPVPGSPRWSPDGRWIAFDCLKDGLYDVHAISVDGGVPRRLTAGPSLNVRPSWSRDGRWIYFGSNRHGEYGIWKIPAQGGAAVQVMNTKGGLEAFESADGQSIYYVKVQESGIWTVPLGGGEAKRVLDQGVIGGWTLTNDGICFFNVNELDGPDLHFFNFAARKPSLLRKFSKDTRIDHFDTAVSASADGRWIIYTQLDHVTNDLMLVENFR
jgi:Tol biopolymer transport system component/DNA-binding winged helix-turn-helix (wHTH) protein